MAVIRGSFAENTPLVSLTVRAGTASVPITAVIDTGFAGFAAILAAAQIELGGQRQGGLVHVTSGEALIGIDLLRAFHKIFVLSVSAGAVLLVDSVAEAI